MNTIKKIIIKSLKYTGQTIANFLLVLHFMLLKIISFFKKVFNLFICKPIISFINCLKNKKTILVTGYAREDKLKFLLEKVYKIHGEYQQSKATFESNDYKFIVYFGLDSGDFDRNKFKETCKNIKNLTAIICIENLNPRSNGLKGNLEELRYVFTSDELREKLYVFFTFGTSTRPSSLEKLREDVLDFNEMFNMLKIYDKKRFVDERAWILHLMDKPIPSPTGSFINIYCVILIVLAIISIIYTFSYYRNNKPLTHPDLPYQIPSKPSPNPFVPSDTKKENADLTNSNKFLKTLVKILPNVDIQNSFADTPLNFTPVDETINEFK